MRDKVITGPGSPLTTKKTFDPLPACLTSAASRLIGDNGGLKATLFITFIGTVITPRRSWWVTRWRLER